MSVRKGNDVLAGSAPIRIDSTLNEDSVNPIQNKTVAAALNTKQDAISAGDGIEITDDTVAVGDLDCGAMS